MTSDIIHRYKNGEPSDALGNAGLLVHMIEAGRLYQSEGEPWESGCSKGSWCGGIDHESCSLINHRHNGLFNHGVGLILSPGTRILCAFNWDNGLQGIPLGGCGRAQCRPDMWWDCSWPSNELKAFMTSHEQHGLGRSRNYNEVVVTSKDWNDNLPEMIDAIVFGSDYGAKGAAQMVHRRFLKRFGGSVSHVPLLKMQLGNLDVPFVLANDIR